MFKWIGSTIDLLPARCVPILGFDLNDSLGDSDPENGIGPMSQGARGFAGGELFAVDEEALARCS
jgi:hypothetical protein